MLFNSTSYAIFLPIVFFAYWFLSKRNLRVQNVMLLVASYYFYSCWDWRFLFLLIFSTLLDYVTGIKIGQALTPRSKKFWLWLSIVINLGFLGVFKYYNFFVESFTEALGQIGIQASPWTLGIILPVGISFYTFHGLSYIIDIYYGRIRAEKNIIDYALFVTFFPLLVAGPIERATHLLPQIKKERTFDYSQAVDGLRQILWGLFKKIVIADSCALYVNDVFGNSAEHSGSTLFLAAVLFAFQIYGDFSGYSDIALGTARLFGIELLRNFAFPYFSRDIAEFWRRWHISLSSWFRDYVYVPLGGSRGGKWMQLRNTFIIFLLSGFWHGANWTFIVWGLLNAMYFIPLLLVNRNRQHLDIVAQNATLPSMKEFFQISFTFFITVIAWVFFRSDTVGQSVDIIARIFSSQLLEPAFVNPRLRLTLALIVFFIVVEWSGRRNQYAIQTLFASSPRPVRWAFYNLIGFAIIMFAGQEYEFIYFQF
ncbi:MAG TPA: MBOAT family O-acyltransferase [Chryseosolibacter sp.]